MEEFKNQEKEESFSKDPLKRAYFLIHGEDPGDMEYWMIAKRILEVLDDPNWIDQDLAKECIYQIVCQVEYPNPETQKDIIIEAEQRARNIFPELKNIDEPHSDQIEYYYRRWKEQKEKNNI